LRGNFRFEGPVFWQGMTGEGHVRRRDPLHWGYRLRLERSLVLTLAAAIALFVAFKRMEKGQPPPMPKVALRIEVEEVPITRQVGGSRLQPPRRPAVPVEAESEPLPTDEVIGSGLSSGSMPGAPGEGSGEGGAIFYLPRAVREAIPEFPAKLRGKVRGTVELMLRIGPSGEVEEVLVVSNTTGSAELERAAVEAARHCLFVPPRDSRGQAVSVWMRKTYTFE